MSILLTGKSPPATERLPFDDEPPPYSAADLPPEAHQSNGKTRLFVGVLDFIKSIKPPEWLLEGIIQRGYLYGLTAQTNHGKTALAAPLAISVGLGLPFAGRYCEKGHVLYLCGENPDDFKLRILGSCLALGLEPTDLDGKITIMPYVANLTAFHLNIMEFATNQPLAAIIVDTSVAYFSYDDENANVQARQHAQDLRQLVNVAGKPAVLALCHPIKGAADENLVPRGGGAFLNELDCNLTLWKDGEIANFSHNKMRGPAFQSIQFQIEPFILPGILDTKGNPVTTVIVRHLSDAAATAFQREQLSEADQVLNCVYLNPDQSLADIALKLEWTVEDGKPYKSKVHRIIARLEHAGLLKKVLGELNLTESGKNRAKSNSFAR